jgi:hypothetical protein
VLKLVKPNIIPGILEQGLTNEVLEPYSDSAWSVTLPWFWLKNNTVIAIGVKNSSGFSTKHYELVRLGAPH